MDPVASAQVRLAVQEYIGGRSELRFHSFAFTGAERNPMASHGTLVLLVAFALVVGGFMEGVNGEESLVRRRLAGHPLGASAVVVPATFCPIICGGIFNPLFPNCCQNTVIPGLPPVYFCSNNQMDLLNCGVCGKSCIANGITVGVACCAGTCTNLLTDASNCGYCNNKCPALDVCRYGLCSYGG